MRRMTLSLVLTAAAAIYGKGVSVLDGALKQFRQAGYHRGIL